MKSGHELWLERSALIEEVDSELFGNSEWLPERPEGSIPEPVEVRWKPIS